MRITWGAAILALAVAAGAYTVSMAPVAAQGAALTQDKFPTAMKTVQATAGSLRMKIMMNQLPDAAKDAQTLAATFSDVEKFFASKNKSDAVGWAQAASKGFTAVAAAATAGDAMKAQMELGTTQANCKSCHAQYREQVPGSQPPTFQFKAGAI
jgi:cytochrome c556